MALTVKRVARLTKPGRYRDGAVRGLYLQVMSASNRSWLLRYALHGQERWLGLGSVETFSLAEARQRAHAARQLLADKIDPLTVRRSERAERSVAAARHKTFRVVAEQYDAAHGAGWSKKYRANFLASLQRYAYPLIGDLPGERHRRSIGVADVAADFARPHRYGQAAKTGHRRSNGLCRRQRLSHRGKPSALARPSAAPIALA